MVGHDRSSPDKSKLPRCQKGDGSSLRIVPSYIEGGYFSEANCVTITDGERTAVYVPYEVNPHPHLRVVDAKEPDWRVLLENLVRQIQAGDPHDKGGHRLRRNVHYIEAAEALGISDSVRLR
jgi:hypothetical protein